MKMREELLKLKNIGEKTADWLIDVGITSPQQIELLGAIAVYRQLRSKYPVNRTALWALQGALMNIPYNQIPEDVKEILLEELKQYPDV